MYPSVHHSTSYNSQNMEETQMSISRRMDKEAVVHIYNGILLSHKKSAFESVLTRWMNLELIVQSEVSQKNKYHILTHIYGIQKDGTDEPVCRAAMDTQAQRTNLLTPGGGREERMGCMQRVTWKHALPQVKQKANENLLSDSGNSNQGSGTAQRGGSGRELGGGSRWRGHRYPCG